MHCLFSELLGLHKFEYIHIALKILVAALKDSTVNKKWRSLFCTLHNKKKVKIVKRVNEFAKQATASKSKFLFSLKNKNAMWCMSVFVSSAFLNHLQSVVLRNLNSAVA